MLIGGSMSFSLPFAFPEVAFRTHLPPSESFETAGAEGLLAGMAISMVLGGILFFIGRRQSRRTAVCERGDGDCGIVVGTGNRVWAHYRFTLAECKPARIRDRSRSSNRCSKASRGLALPGRQC